jgi:hypothetical protein
LTLFTAANPGIESGGFAGESKSSILALLSRVPDFTLILASLPAAARLKTLHEFMAERSLSYPIVLKPDVGERGKGVAIVRNNQEARTYLELAAVDTIVQEYIHGLEFGIFYCRYPGEPEGRILSITEKHFPAVIGDGKSCLRDLILRDERAVCLAGLYLRRLNRSAAEVPAQGERIALAELGSHCRGAIFLDGARLKTEALRAAVDAMAQSHSGFYFGRFDVRSSSIPDLQAGRFKVLELNGVSAEATHIYDPAMSLLDAYRTLFRQWSIAFEIGAINRAAGFAPMPLNAFLRLVHRCVTRRDMHATDRGIPASYDRAVAPRKAA